MTDINRELGLGSGGIEQTDPKLSIPLDSAKGVMQDAKEIADDVLDKARDFYDLAKPEVESIAGSVKRSSSRLESRPRVISFIPNTALFYGLIGLGVWWIARK